MVHVRFVVGGVSAVLGGWLAESGAGSSTVLFALWVLLAATLVAGSTTANLSRELRPWLAPTGNRLPFATAVCMVEGRQRVRATWIAVMCRAGVIAVVSLTAAAVFAPAVVIALALGSLYLLCGAWARVYASALILARGGIATAAAIRAGSAALWLAGGSVAYSQGWGVVGVAGAGAVSAMIEAPATIIATWLYVFPLELWPLRLPASQSGRPTKSRNTNHPARLSLRAACAIALALLENDAFVLGLLVVVGLKSLHL